MLENLKLLPIHFVTSPIISYVMKAWKASGLDDVVVESHYLNWGRDDEWMVGEIYECIFLT